MSIPEAPPEARVLYKKSTILQLNLDYTANLNYKLIPQRRGLLEDLMKKFFLAGVLTLAASVSGMTMAMAEGTTMVSGCGTDVMFVYDAPRDDAGSIVFARSYDLDKGALIDETKLMEVSGAPICLPAGSGNVHRLRLGGGVEIDLSSQSEVTKVVRWLEDESYDEAVRVEKAYGIKTASN